MVRFALAHSPVFLVRDGSRPPYGSAPEPPAPETPSAPDPCDDADALEALGDAIATLAADIHAATHRMLVMIAEFDRRRGWEAGGHASCADWLSFRTGIDKGAAREKVRAARALVGLPRISDAMSRGELSFSKVRALTRVATPESEGDLLDLARGCPTARLEQVVRAWKRGSRADEAARERELHASRRFSVFPDEEGMYVVKGRLTPEVAAVLMKAVEAAGDALFREAWTPGTSREEAATQASRRRADAVGLLAERALAAGFGRAPAGDGGASTGDGRASAGDGGVSAETSHASEAPISGSRAERYQVMLHVDADTLSAEAEPGRSELDDGTRVSAETSRRLACDCSVVRVRRGKDGRVLDVGRRTRSIPPALRRALEVRDRGCRFPGCGRRFTDGHHVVHWADGGETSLGNTVLLCRLHHGLVHEGGWRIHWWGEGRPAFFDPRGGMHYDGRWKDARAAERAGSAAALIAANRAEGVAPDGWTAGARWKREADIPDAVLFGAVEGVAG